MFTHRIADDLELRLYEESDADELFAVVDADRAHLRQWLPWLDRIKGVEDERAFIRASRERFARENGFNAGIWHDGRFVGSVGLHYIDRANRKTEIGYWLAASAQGRGIMTRAVRVVLREMFEAQKLNRVALYAATENHRSRAVAERVGFTLEGVAREAEWLYEHFHDLAIYSMLAREWKE
jgi:ribosomal-protein-serine acetyltransferase